MFGFLPGHVCCCRDSAAVYQAHFCGLCTGMERTYGYWSRALINRDSTLLTLLVSALSHNESAFVRSTCCNPLGRARTMLNPESASAQYAAAVTICGLVTKLLDDAADEKGARRGAAEVAAHLLAEAESKAAGHLHAIGFPVATVRGALGAQTGAEQNVADILVTAGATRAAYGEIIAFTGRLAGCEEMTTAHLRAVGQHLGLLVYAKDAWDDWEKDRRQGRFNPLSDLATANDRSATLAPVLRGAMAGLENEFAALPLRRYRDLLRTNLVEGCRKRVDAILNPKVRQRRDDDPDCCRWRACDWWCDCNPKCCGCGKANPAKGGDCGPCDCNPCDGDCGCGCCTCDCCPSP